MTDHRANSSTLRVVLVARPNSPIVIPLVEAGVDVVGLVAFGRAPKASRTIASAVRTVYRRLAGAQPSPAAVLQEKGIPVLFTQDVRDPSVAEWLKDRRADALVVYRVPILPPSLYGCVRWAVNLHPSLLPKYRGSHPLFWAVWDGEPTAGCSVHFLEEKADTGAVLAQEEFPIADGVSEPELERFAEVDVGVPLLLRSLKRLGDGTLSPIVQPTASPTPYAKRMERAEIYRSIPFGEWPLERVWRVLRFLQLSPKTLEGNWSSTGLTWHVGRYRRVAGAGEPGTLQIDWRGFYVSHPEGRIRVTPGIRPKAIIARILDVASGSR